MRKTIKDIAACKGHGKAPLVCLTAYTAPMATLFDEHCDALLVGDSVAMVVYGEPSTLQADMDMMIRHGRAVVNATKNALVMVDMPFGSYQESKEIAFRNAARIIRETGATCVKLEGGAEMAETIAYLSERGVPVVGHIGLQPQSVNIMGGYKAQGRDEDGARKIMDDAKAVANAGAFAIVIEGVAETLGTEITKTVSCPTIGIGASVHCDGQILVAEDMLGIITGPKPKFVKIYAELADAVSDAVKTYAGEVRAREFPQAANVYAAANTSKPPAPEAIVTETPVSMMQPILTRPDTDDLKGFDDEQEEKNFFADIVLRATRRARD